MPENTQNRQTPCPLWIWAILLLGLIMLYLLYSRATSEKALEIQQDIQVRTTENLLKSGHSGEITASTDGRDVTLKGLVSSQDEKTAAGNFVMRTIGVRQVNNQICLGQPGVSAKPTAAEPIASAKLEPLPTKFPILTATVKPMPQEFAPLEDKAVQAVEIAQEQFNQIDFSNITFENGSAELTPIAQQTLDSAAKTLLENPSVIIAVAGHTDSSGNPELNLKLSNQRAKSVLNYLVNAGVESTRIEANGYGDQFPIAPNETKAGRIKNRRIEIKVKNGE